MKLVFSFMVFSLCAACGASTVPQLRRAPPQTVTVDGSVFDIRMRGTKAEAIRTNFEFPAKYGPIRRKAITAIETLTPCKVGKTLGDPSVVIAELDCPEKDAVL